MEDVSEEEQLDNEDVMEKRVKFNTKQEDDDDDSSDEDDSDLADGDKPLFLNPLLLNGNDTKNKKKPKIDEDEVSEGEWSSEEEEKKKDLEKKAKKESLLGKRKKRGDENEIKDFFKNEHFEVVPQDNLEKEDGNESLDSDDIAETRALAKLMLRKKTRNEILDSTYNKFVTHEDKSQLPSWFNEDEDKHFKPFLPVTKEMVAEEKKILKEYNERPSKKVAEAKARKKRRLGKAMNKVKAKAQVIADT
jgi:AdoMet-dependent rRNA methyltransferase SPB1